MPVLSSRITAPALGEAWHIPLSSIHFTLLPAHSQLLHPHQSAHPSAAPDSLLLRFLTLSEINSLPIHPRSLLH